MPDKLEQRSYAQNPEKRVKLF